LSTFGEALRDLLDEHGMKQAELARRLDISAQAVSTWVTGNTTPSRENVERVEDELAIEPRGFLLEIAGYSRNSTDQPTVESLVRADPGLDPEDKRVILRILALARERHSQAQ
jgi:transcriptional regulator with XRE-family HTH domain